MIFSQIYCENMDMAMKNITQTFNSGLKKIIDSKINKLGIWQIFGKHDKLQRHRTNTAVARFCSVKSKQMVLLPVLAMMENLNNKHISSYTAHVARCLINLN